MAKSRNDDLHQTADEDLPPRTDKAAKLRGGQTLTEYGIIGGSGSGGPGIAKIAPGAIVAPTMKGLPAEAAKKAPGKIPGKKPGLKK